MEKHSEHPNSESIRPQEQSTVASKSTKKVFLFTVLILAVIVGVTHGIYTWQHNQLATANQKVVTLQAQLSSANKQGKTSQSNSTQSPSGTFTYTPRLGGLSLMLPKTYGVLVGADGNDGGAPGVDFKVVPLSATNFANDWDYTNEAKVQVGGFTSLSNAVSSEELQMQQDGDCSTIDGSCNTTNFTATDTTIGGQPAKLIIAKAANEYLGSVNVYVGGLGPWGYVITSDSTTQPDNHTPTALLSAVLKGVTLKQANWP